MFLIREIKTGERGVQNFQDYGVPTYYMNQPIAEPAGSGNTRVWNCVRRNGVLVPVCEIIIPAIELIEASRIISTVALQTLKMELELRVAH